MMKRTIFRYWSGPALFAALVSSLLVFGVPGSLALGAPSTYSNVVFSDGFESGSLGAWNGTPGTGSASVTAAAAHTSGYGLRLTNTSGQYALVVKRLASPLTDSSVSFWVRFTSPTGLELVAQARDDSSSQHMWDLMYDGARGGLYFYPFRGSTSTEIWTGAKTLAANTWAKIDIQYTATASGGAQLYVNGQTKNAWGVRGDYTRSANFQRLQLWNDSISTTDFDDASVATPPPPAATVPGSPTGVTGTPGDRSVALKWTAPASDGGSAVTGYRVTPYAGGVAQAPMLTGSAATNYTVTGLTNGTAYTFTIAAINAVGRGSDSLASAPVTPAAPTAPSAPTNVQGTARDAAVSLTWVAASDGGSAITGYRVTPYVGGVARAPILTGSAATSHTVTGLTNGTAYTFTIAAINSVGTGPDSAASAPVTPAKPPPGTTVVSLEFDDGVSNQWSARQTLRDHGARATFFVNSELTTDQTGGYRMTWAQLHDLATDGHEITGHSLTHVDLTLQTPEEQRHQICDDRTNLLNRGFSPVANFAYPFAAYEQNGVKSMVQQCGYSSARIVGGVRSSTCATCPYAESIPPLDPFATRTPPDIRNTVSLATMQSYVTQAENNGGGWVQLVFHQICDNCDEYSTTLPQLTAFLDWLQPRAATGTVVKTVAEVLGSAAPPGATIPGLPTGVSGTARDRSVTLSWTAPSSDGGSTITGFRITPYVGASAQTPISTGSPATSYTVMGLTNGTAYTFKVAAVNAVGSGPDSTASAPVTPTPAPATAPGAPTGVVGTARDGAVALSWTSPGSDGGSAITGYRVTPYAAGSAQAPIATGSTATSYTVTGLTNGRSYTFTIVAINAVGPGPESAPSSPVTPASAPGAPTGVAGTPRDAAAALTWTAPNSDGGSAITGYRVTAYSGGTAQTPVLTNSNATSYTLTGLTNGSTYTFTVSAINGIGVGPDSTASAPVTPAPPPPSTAPGAPTSVSGSPRSGAVALTWTVPSSDGGSGITRYRVTPYVGATAQAPVVTGSNATNYMVTGLTNGTAYTFTVAATNAIGTGADSAASAPVTPVAPTGIVAMPVLSRGVPAFTNDACYPPSNANDANYATVWRTCNGTASTTSPKWLAYDLSSIPGPHPGAVVVAWYNDPVTGSFDHTVSGGPGYNLPKDYTIEVNAAPGGGGPPATGWSTLATVSGNTFNSRQHVVNFTGSNWLRINVTASDGAAGNADVALNMDVHDASGGVTDDWIFYGDSITQDGLLHDNRTSALGSTVGTFAQLVNTLKPGYFPAFQNGGIGGLASADGAARVATWLTFFPGKYVALNYGTNDALAGAGDPTIAKRFHDNLETMVRAVAASGKTPIVPTIPWGRDAKLQANVPVLNEQISILEAAYPQIVAGPDLYSLFKNNQSLISSDGVHPTWDNGYAALREEWAKFAGATFYP